MNVSLGNLLSVFNDFAANFDIVGLISAGSSGLGA